MTNKMNNYFCYHIHSDLSNAVTNVDSVTKYHEYVARAKECGMTTFGFSEHGSTMEWWHKKTAIENAGMKYAHMVECYLTATLYEKIRDNYHCVLIARNYDGFLELNRMITKSFNRKDNHFYYVPRISFNELAESSDNIIFTTACVGGVFGKAREEDGRLNHIARAFYDFMKANAHRCFFEIGHHQDEKQKEYNKLMVRLSEECGVRLIAGTDTHALNEDHELGRSILQKSKNIHFDGEDNWDLKFKTYDELVYAYETQGVLPNEIYLEAIENTNVLADMIQPFELDKGTKYPHIYESPEETFKQKVNDAVRNHPYAMKNHDKKELFPVVREEYEVYKKTGSIDFMLLQTYQREWEKSQGIECGYGRGSVSGSEIAYLLGITQMDSLRFNLNFFRFMNPARVTNADIDTDYSGKDRDRVKEFLLRDKMNLPNINTAEIITFNTIALKGAIRDVCRALYKEDESVDYLALSSEIVKLAEENEDAAREKYQELFRYVDIVNGTIVSVGTHPSGVLVSDLPIEETIGLCSISSSDYPVSIINMKELDDLMYVKLDILGLDNIGVINDTCKMLGIERLTPDNTDLEDEDVWKSIRDDTTLIFQWESKSASAYLKRFMSDKTLEIARSKIPNFSMIKWLSFGNGLIRPACASFRDSVAKGEFYDNGFDALNEFLAPEAGRLAMQETIMQFLVKFCGYSDAESDTVRRGIAKKKGTEQLLPEIERRFIEYCTTEYDMSKEECERIIKPFIQVILDASAYSFSWNHSDSYSCIGYICGYLRYYYPYEFLTAALNIFGDNMDKTVEITRYAAKRGISVTTPKWGASRDTYSFNKEDKTIAKGLSSVKYMNANIAESLYELSQENTYTLRDGRLSFIELLLDIDQKTSVNSRQLEILIKLDFFFEFGNQNKLLRIVDVFNTFKQGKAKQIRRELVDGTEFGDIISNYADGKTKSGGEAKSYKLLDVHQIMIECEERIMNALIEDASIGEKMWTFEEYMGYAGYYTGYEKDNNKLFIRNIKPLKRARDNRLFAYNITTRSVGNGKESQMTVNRKLYEETPIKKGDIIACLKWSRNRGYFQLDEYRKVDENLNYVV